MSGIIFFKTKSPEEMHSFYFERLNMKLWLKQKNCNIYQSGNLLLGFLKSDTIDQNATITFFIQDKTEIDALYQKLKDIIFKEIKENKDYNIYHFYVKDPEGREVEFQTFLHNVESYHNIDEALIERRSIRQFTDIDVSDEILNKIFNICKYSPTARNSQSFYFIVIRNKESLKWLASTREGATKPVENSNISILVVADSKKTQRPEQDACIAASYLMLSAYSYGLGSCWVTDMNKKEVKSYFNIPEDDYVACAVALGYPAEKKDIPQRREIGDFIHFEKKCF